VADRAIAPGYIRHRGINEELADAASEKLLNAFVGFAEFEYGEPRLVAGDLVYAYTRGS